MSRTRAVTSALVTCALTATIGCSTAAEERSSAGGQDGVRAPADLPAAGEPSTAGQVTFSPVPPTETESPQPAPSLVPVPSPPSPTTPPLPAPPTQTPTPVPTAGVCAGLAECRVVGQADVDADGRADEVGERGTVDGSQAGVVEVLVLTAAGQRLATFATYDFWSQPSLWHGTRDIDGAPGDELVLGAGAGAHTLVYQVLTVRDGALQILPPPNGRDWFIDAAFRTAVGWSCGPGGRVVNTVASRGTSTRLMPVGPDEYEVVTTAYVWDGTTWQVESDTVEVWAGDDPRYSTVAGWHCAGLPNGF